MSIPITPEGDYVLVQPDKPETKTASGFYIPETAQQKSDIAVIVAVGSEVKNAKVGERVIYVEDYQRTKTVSINKEEYVLVSAGQIIAKVK